MHAYRLIHSIVFAITSSFLLPGPLSSMPAAKAEARLFMVPAGESPADYSEGPTEVLLHAGQSIRLEIFLENTSPVLLRSFRVRLQEPQDGTSGTLMFDIGSAGIDTFRPDYVFVGGGFDGFAVQQGPPQIFFAEFPGGREVMEPRYLGELSYTASTLACGKFIVDFFAEPEEPKGFGTVLHDPNLEIIPFVSERTIIDIAEHGDLDASGEIDISDMFIVLDGFMGRFLPGYTLSDVDLSSEVPCARDGVIDILDIFAVLDAIQAVDACAARCIPE